MNFREYLADKKFLILFYVILMVFISLVMFLDYKARVSLNNIIYVHWVGFVFFSIYLITDYLSNKRYYSRVQEILKDKNNTDNLIYKLPQPKRYDQKLFHSLLIINDETQKSRLEHLYSDKKDYLEFVTSWVHEIKTPIAVTNLLIETNNDDKCQEILDSIEEEVIRIEDYVEQALYYSRIDAFSKDYFINELQLNVLVKQIIKKYAKTFINKKVRIKFNSEENLIVSSDKKWLTYIVNQILTNALKYVEEEGIVTISYETDEKEKRLIIEDNGIGIKNEDIERVFEKGFTGYNGREHSKSTGMGLYLAKNLAKKLGHEISIQSEYGEYTKVTIHFPKLLNYYL